MPMNRLPEASVQEGTSRFSIPQLCDHVLLMVAGVKVFLLGAPEPARTAQVMRHVAQASSIFCSTSCVYARVSLLSLEPWGVYTDYSTSPSSVLFAEI